MEPAPGNRFRLQNGESVDAGRSRNQSDQSGWIETAMVFSPLGERDGAGSLVQSLWISRSEPFLGALWRDYTIAHCELMRGHQPRSCSN